MHEADIFLNSVKQNILTSNSGVWGLGEGRGGDTTKKKKKSQKE